MHTPYTDSYPQAVAIAAQSLAASLGAVLWARPLGRRSANVLFGAALVGIVALPDVPDLALSPSIKWFVYLQLCQTAATIALGLVSPRRLGVAALVGQVGLFLLGRWVYASNDEVMFAHLAVCGVLLGLHALRATPPGAGTASLPTSFIAQDIAIFGLTVALATVCMHYTFEEVIYNGDEVANSFQADLYAHFKAYATPRPCAASFENFWVFNYKGRLFSQYTPGWPLFMAPFQRLGVIWIAGPSAAGVVAVGVARLSRRIVSGFGATLADTGRIVRVAGPLGAGFAMLGPSMLLNGASRFSHTLVAACFAWAVETAAAVATPGISRRRSFGYGVGLGIATALGVATRPTDGSTLGVGVFLYFAFALARRRVKLAGFLGTCLGFGAVGGLTLVILHLQLGGWFRTGYSINHLYHASEALVFSPPGRAELKFSIPLATGSYCWWPVAPALGLGGFVSALSSRERRVPFMLSVGSICIILLYASVTYGRGVDDGLGPRYILPVVVAQATGTAGLLAPLLARLVQALTGRELLPRYRFRLVGPGLLMLVAGIGGAARLAPLVYPSAYSENHAATAPLRAARAMGLKNAVVLMQYYVVPAHVTNLAQNAPMDPNPSVLNLIRYSPADDACIEKHFPGRTWYEATMEDKLLPFKHPARHEGTPDPAPIP